MKGRPIHDYDRYYPLPSGPGSPIGDYERHERAAERRKTIWGAVLWFLIVFLGMILKELAESWLDF